MMGKRRMTERGELKREIVIAIAVMKGVIVAIGRIVVEILMALEIETMIENEREIVTVTVKINLLESVMSITLTDDLHHQKMLLHHKQTSEGGVAVRVKIVSRIRKSQILLIMLDLQYSTTTIKAEENENLVWIRTSLVLHQISRLNFRHPTLQLLVNQRRSQNLLLSLSTLRSYGWIQVCANSLWPLAQSVPVQSNATLSVIRVGLISYSLLTAFT